MRAPFCFHNHIRSVALSSQSQHRFLWLHSDMMPALCTRLLGDFSLVFGDALVTAMNTVCLQSLLAYLVLHRDVPQSRQHVAFLL